MIIRQLTKRGLSLPNLLVPIDLRDGAPTEPSLLALGESRRLARDAGVTVFAVVLTDALPQEDVERVSARLGLAGADKVLFCEAPGLSAPPLDATHGTALATAIDRVPPLLVLFPAGGAGAQLGPALASRLGAAFASAADIEVADSPLPLTDSVGRVQLRRWRRDRSSYRRLDPVEMERPVIATLAAHGRRRDAGTEHVEVDVIECPPPKVPSRVVELESVPDDDAAVSLARVLVLVDGANPALGGPGEVAARLRAAAPAGVVVADLASASPAAVAAATPEILVCVGMTEVPASPSPLTRVAMVLVGDTPDPPRGAADVVWRVDAAATGGAAWEELGGALARLGSGARDEAAQAGGER